MSMYELLSTEEKELIDWYIETYGSASGDSHVSGHRKAPMEHVLRHWNEAKSSGLLADIFDGELIKSFPVNYSVPTDELVDRLYRDSRIETYTRAFSHWRRMELTDDMVKDRNGNTGFQWELDELINYYTLASNEYHGDTLYVADPSKGPDHWIAINPGCKPVKVLGKLNQAYHISETFEDFRIAHSMALNTAKVRGNLCISIHPMDFMTMSDNGCGWESCMSWTQGGSYRAGTVEMLNSPNVLVAYLTASEPFRMYDREWNNKKWRSLYIVDEDIISNVKGYPYQLPEVDKIVISTIADILQQKRPNMVYSEVKGYNYECDRVFDGNYDVSFNTDHMYNDFGSIEHFCSVRPGVQMNRRISYSGVSECMWCGETDPCIDEDDQIFCDSCESYCTCDNCGSHVSEYDLHEVGSGSMVCGYCLDEYYDKDVFGEWWHHDDLDRVYVVPDELKPYVENKTLKITSLDYSVPAFNYHADYHQPWGGETMWERNAVQIFESDCLKDGRHVKYEVERSWFGRKYIPYVFKSDLDEQFINSYNEVIEREFGDDANELQLYLRDPSYWDHMALTEARETLGGKISA